MKREKIGQKLNYFHFFHLKTSLCTNIAVAIYSRHSFKTFIATALNEVKCTMTTSINICFAGHSIYQVTLVS